MATPDVLAIVVAGGSARRLGGVAKPTVYVAGVRMVDRVLDAVSTAGRIVVVGPALLDLPDRITRVVEDPPLGGPVAAIAAGLQVLDDPSRAGAPRAGAPGAGDPGRVGDPAGPVRGDGPRVVLLAAADLPLLTAGAVAELVAAVAEAGHGAVFVDPDGRRQWLCSAWPIDALRRRLAELIAERGTATGGALRDLLGPMRATELTSVDDPPPWFDCDTAEDIRRAEDWLTR